MQPNIQLLVIWYLIPNFYFVLCKLESLLLKQHICIDLFKNSVMEPTCQFFFWFWLLALVVDPTINKSKKKNHWQLLKSVKSLEYTNFYSISLSLEYFIINIISSNRFRELFSSFFFLGMSTVGKCSHIWRWVWIFTTGGRKIC